jgi:hypothetical protein
MTTTATITQIAISSTNNSGMRRFKSLSYVGMTVTEGYKAAIRANTAAV